MSEAAKKAGKPNPILTLIVLCCVLCVVLALVNALTKPVIDARTAQDELRAYQEISQGYVISGGAHEVGEGQVLSYYEMNGDGGTGYILNLEGSGYGGKFTIAASYDSEGNLIAAKMLDNSETPGLGKKSEESWYMPIFTRYASIPSSKGDLDDSDRALVSGASVTFSGVSKALSAGRKWVLGRRR